MQCSRCGNSDKRMFHKDDKGYYCRKCIMFGRINVEDTIVDRKLPDVQKTTELVLEYSLTKKQLEISSELIQMIQVGESGLVYAACGAGKTEIVMPAIEHCINHNLRIGFAISRREVVLELSKRLSSVFPNLDVIAVCEGYTDRDIGDLIICTTHQLYRYPSSFDVLILDEIDAFPYAGNPVLEHIALHASKSSVIYLTATPDHSLMNQVKEGKLRLYELYARPHGFPLIIPVVKRRRVFMQIISMFLELNKMMKLKKPVLVFVPTIAWTKKLYRVLKIFYTVSSISSLTKDKEKMMEDFQCGTINILVSTTVLERGITISDVQVLVLMGDHNVFSEASLIQIIGRVGRKKEFPSGQAIIYAKKKTSTIANCIKTLNRMNEYA